MPEPTPFEDFEDDDTLIQDDGAYNDQDGNGGRNGEEANHADNGHDYDDVQEVHPDDLNNDEFQNEDPAPQDQQSGRDSGNQPRSNASMGSDELAKLVDEELQDNQQSQRDLRSVNSSRASSRGSSDSPHGWRDKFKITLTQPLEKEHACPECKDVLRYPVKLGCGHRLCYSCHQDIARVEPRCPVDQASFEKEKPKVDKAFSKEILALEVICSNNDWGCTWKGTYGEVLIHNEKCDYADILCANDCGAKFQRRFLQKHLDKDCPKRIIPCAYCDERHLREEKRQHLEDCKKVPLPCPNKCDKKLTIPREELDAHIEQECPRTKIMCQYEDIGCPHRCSREKLPKHYKTGIIEHVRLIYDLVMDQGRRLDNNDVQLQDHLNLLQNHQERLGDLERISRNQLIWRIEDYARKLKEAKAGSTTTLFSPSFTTSKHGYRLAASVCLNGDGKGKGSHVSVFVSVLRGAYDALLKWPFDFRVTFYLLDQQDDTSARKHIKFSIKPNPCQENEPFLGRPRLEKNASFGGAKFAKQEDVESRGYIRDDTIFIKITIDCDGSSEP
eukprot:gene14291-15778_t